MMEWVLFSGVKGGYIELKSRGMIGGGEGMGFGELRVK